MHEKVWRGRGGQISIWNSVLLCHRCHEKDKVAGHGSRQPQFTSKTQRDVL
jgi:cytochrome c553